MTAQGEDILAWLDNAISEREDALRPVQVEPCERPGMFVQYGETIVHIHSSDSHDRTDVVLLDLHRNHAFALAGGADGQPPAWNSPEDYQLLAFVHVPQNIASIQKTHIATAQTCHSPKPELAAVRAAQSLVKLHGGRAHSCPAFDEDGDYDDRVRFYDHEVCPVIQHLADGYGWTAGQTPPTEGDQVT